MLYFIYIYIFSFFSPFPEFISKEYLDYKYQKSPLKLHFFLKKMHLLAHITFKGFEGLV